MESFPVVEPFQAAFEMRILELLFGSEKVGRSSSGSIYLEWEKKPEIR